MRRIPVITLLTLSALLFAQLAAGCGSESKIAPPTSPPATSTTVSPTSTPTIVPTHGPPQTVAVTITDTAFSPSQLIVNVGDTVVWTNSGAATHWIVEDRSMLFSSGLLLPGQSFSYTFQQAGGFQYHCDISSWMVGSVVVR